MLATILIVDDTPANLSVLVETLSDAGYFLMVAEDGEDALAQTDRTLPDLVLLDVMMPGLGGFETCRRLKASERTRNIPVIFMTALNDASEKVRAFSAGAVDYITKPIQQEEALARISTHLTIRRLQGELESQLELKEKFMRIASHDLRNPLSLILMSGEMAKRRGVPDELAEYLENIQSSAMQMGRIIDTFLNLQRPGQQSSRLDLYLMARSVIGQQELAAERKSITLELEPAAPMAPALADAAITYQALANYVSNAIKFLPRNGRVQVRVLDKGLRARVEVQDSGPGVPVSERTLLFKEYSRLSNRPTDGEESTGLGLSIVRQLIESQAGCVGASFPADGGSVFWFELPLTA